ncbi:fibrocystin-L-like [Macrobrachium nipponense]|uniref:fibrocystin-L-like n=1 Tax=Macrobrachium nipponense TaxID=159736 RepID=UPI0030C80C84
MSDHGAFHTLTITGSEFRSNNTKDFLVSLGEGRTCNVTAVTSTTVTCTARNLTAGSHPLSVFVQPAGIASMERPLFVEVPSKPGGVGPLTGAGTLREHNVTLAVPTFPMNQWANISVRIGGSTCKITEINNTSLKCVAPSGAEGRVIIIIPDGQNATSVEGFFYNSSLSLGIIFLSPEKVSATGFETLAISGRGFGTDGAHGEVRVGDQVCPVLHWTETLVTCQVPAGLRPGQHFVLLATREKNYSRVGFVNVTFSVTGSSLRRGSVYGGTALLLKGGGFGDNCSLIDVAVGEDMTCDVASCSNDTIRCVTRRIQRRHYIRNTGSLIGYGPGYAWEPKKLAITEGDAVAWAWQRSDPFSLLSYNVFSTPSPSVKDFDGKGFRSGPATPAGTFGYAFPNSGTYYYASDPLSNGIVLSGQVEVTAPTPGFHTIRVTVAGVEAEYKPNGQVVSVTLDECGANPTAVEAISGCPDGYPTIEDKSAFVFVTHLCWTPQITGVSANQTPVSEIFSGLQVTVGTTLNITGTGFGSNTCKAKVKIGETHCRVTSVSDRGLSCTVEDQEDLISLRPLPIEVTIADSTDDDA